MERGLAPMSIGADNHLLNKKSLPGQLHRPEGFITFIHFIMTLYIVTQFWGFVKFYRILRCAHFFLTNP